MTRQRIVEARGLPVSTVAERLPGPTGAAAAVEIVATVVLPGVPAGAPDGVPAVAVEYRHRHTFGPSEGIGAAVSQAAVEADLDRATAVAADIAAWRAQLAVAVDAALAKK